MAMVYAAVVGTRFLRQSGVHAAMRSTFGGVCAVFKSLF
jgi:hypothetical protein